MIKRRSMLLAGGIGLLVAHRPSIGQPVATIRRVGWLTIGSEAVVAYLLAALKQGMHDLGWQEGKNIEYRIVYADGDMNRLDASASELVSQKVDVIVVGNAPAARALQRATKTIPIVMANIADPVGNGLGRKLGQAGWQHHWHCQPVRRSAGQADWGPA